MRPITEKEYKFLKTFPDVLELAKSGLVCNGAEAWIPLYEEVTGKPIEKQCSDCIRDMVIILSRLFRDYEKVTTKNVHITLPSHK